MHQETGEPLRIGLEDVMKRNLSVWQPWGRVWSQAESIPPVMTEVLGEERL